MIRTSLLAGFATLALLSAPAMAQNITSLNNTAAGVGNVAVQNAFTKQSGGGFLGGPNIISMGNTAAGVGNLAVQNGTVIQKSPRVGPLGVPFGGGNQFQANNLSAGIGNFAKQNAFGIQR